MFVHMFVKAHAGIFSVKLTNNIIDSIYGIHVSYDSKFFVSISADKNIKIWDINDKKCLMAFEKAHNG